MVAPLPYKLLWKVCTAVEASLWRQTRLRSKRLAVKTRGTFRAHPRVRQFIYVDSDRTISLSCEERALKTSRWTTRRRAWSSSPAKKCERAPINTCEEKVTVINESCDAPNCEICLLCQFSLATFLLKRQFSTVKSSVIATFALF